MSSKWHFYLFLAQHGLFGGCRSHQGPQEETSHHHPTHNHEGVAPVSRNFNQCVSKRWKKDPSKTGPSHHQAQDHRSLPFKVETCGRVGWHVDHSVANGSNHAIEDSQARNIGREGAGSVGSCSQECACHAHCSAAKPVDQDAGDGAAELIDTIHQGADERHTCPAAKNDYGTKKMIIFFILKNFLSTKNPFQPLKRLWKKKSAFNLGTFKQREKFLGALVLLLIFL